MLHGKLKGKKIPFVFHYQLPFQVRFSIVDLGLKIKAEIQNIGLILEHDRLI